MAQNQASLETPLRADKLMTAHFNLAVLSNETNTCTPINAQKPEATTVDPVPSTSTADDNDTYIKILSRHTPASRDTTRVQPTGVVSPTCHTEYRLVNGIPAGYESDNSWDHDSLHHDQAHVHNHNIVPLLTLRTWTNHPNRGQGQPHRLNNNINVRSGNAPYPRPWDNQPYGRCTRSQQAL